MDPFPVVRLAGDTRDRCRQRVQQDTIEHRGRAGEPFYKARRTLHTSASLLTVKQHARRDVVSRFKSTSWSGGIYQRIVAGYREPDKKMAKQLIWDLIDAVNRGGPASLVEIRRLGRTLFERP